MHINSMLNPCAVCELENCWFFLPFFFFLFFLFFFLFFLSLMFWLSHAPPLSFFYFFPPSPPSLHSLIYFSYLFFFLERWGVSHPPTCLPCSLQGYLLMQPATWQARCPATWCHVVTRTPILQIFFQKA